MNKIGRKMVVGAFLFSFVSAFMSNIHRRSVGGLLMSAPRRIDVGEGALGFGKDLYKHSLLTANDEVGLSRQFKLGIQLETQKKILIEQLGREVSDEELAIHLEIPTEQVRLLVDKGDAAKKILVRANMRLVFHIAKYFRFRGLSYPDLIQEGTFGLIKAVDKYDPDRGFRFSTYASWWIKQSVSRAIAEKSRIVRLPVHIHDLMTSLTKAEKYFIMQLGRKPTEQELATHLSLPVAKVQLLMKCGRGVTSTDDSLYQSKAGGAFANDVQAKDRLPSTGADPSSLNEKNSLRSDLRRAMDSLTVREAEIIEMRFGLLDGNPMTLEEIGKHFSVTRERIRQIEARALSKMRHPDVAQAFREGAASDDDDSVAFADSFVVPNFTYTLTSV